METDKIWLLVFMAVFSLTVFPWMVRTTIRQIKEDRADDRAREKATAEWKAELDKSFEGRADRYERELAQRMECELHHLPGDCPNCGAV